MLNYVVKRSFNKEKGVKIKYIMDYIKHPLRKKPHDVIIHAGIKKKVVKSIRETFQGTHISSLSIICREEKKDIQRKIDAMNNNLLNHYKQQMLSFVNNNSIWKTAVVSWEKKS